MSYLDQSAIHTDPFSNNSHPQAFLDQRLDEPMSTFIILSAFFGLKDTKIFTQNEERRNIPAKMATFNKIYEKGNLTRVTKFLFYFIPIWRVVREKIYLFSLSRSFIGARNISIDTSSTFVKLVEVREFENGSCRKPFFLNNKMTHRRPLFRFIFGSFQQHNLLSKK